MSIWYPSIDFLCISAVVAAVVYFVWLLFYRPFDLFRDYTEFGFKHITEGRSTGSNDLKRHIVNQYLRRKKSGDLPPPYPNGWFAILESDELMKNSVKEVNALGLDLVAWRGKKEKCYVADAYCPHLGAHLGVGGKVKEECIECPFHGWRFEGCSGKLAHIPNADSALPSAKLKMWQVHESSGFVYIWYHAENKEPSWWPDVVPEVENSSWKHRGRSEFRVACHIQDIPENGPDTAHLNAVHSPLVTTGSDPNDSKLKWSFLKHIFSASWAPNTEPGREHEAQMLLYHHLELFNKIPFCHVSVKVRQIGPGIVNMYFDTIIGKGFLVQNVTPIEPSMQKVVHRFYSSPTFLHPFGLLVLHSEGVQISRDIGIWNRKTFVRNTTFTKEDKQIRTFRRWYSQFYSGNNPKHQPNNVSNEFRNGKLEF